MTKYGYLGGWVVVPGIALPATHHHTPTPGTPLPTRLGVTVTAGSVQRSIVAVGLISVRQLTLRLLFSGFLGITEGYNLAIVGRINNHFLIPGTERAGVSNPWTGRVFSQQRSIKR